MLLDSGRSLAGRVWAIATAAFILSAIHAGKGFGELVEVGDELRLVDQFRGRISQSIEVAAWSDGSFVLAWSEPEQIDSSGTQIFARIFTASGAPTGAPFRVDTSVDGRVWGPAVTTQSTGAFIVTWIHEDLEGRHVIARVLNGTGAALTGEITVSHGDPRIQNVRAAARDDGEFVIVWSNYYSGQVFARRFFAEGTERGEPFLVAEHRYGYTDNLAVTFTGADEMVIGWQVGSYPHCARSNSYVYVQRYVHDAKLDEPVGLSVPLELYDHCGYVFGDHGFDIASQGGGRWVVAHNVAAPGYYVVFDYPHYWRQEPFSLGIHAERFTHGQPRGPLSVGGDGGNDAPTRGLSATATRRGNFLVVWGSGERDETTHARRYDVHASPFRCRGAAEPPFEFRVNEETDGNQYWPDVAAASNDEFIVTWENKDALSGERSVRGRRYLFEDACSTCGDVDDDGAIMSSDALGVLRGALTLEVCEPWLCDADGDGELKVRDALRVLLHATGGDVVLECTTDTHQPLSANE